MQVAQTIRVQAVMDVLEQWAPPVLQESYDNSGLLVGDPTASIQSVLVSLDCTEAVVEEAARRGAGMIVSHHPIVFQGLKRLTGSNHVERTVMAAIRHGIALYAIHTNLDNVADGVNQKLATAVGCMPDSLRILRPKPAVLNQVVVYVPQEHAGSVQDAMFEAGAGKIGQYDECGWAVQGQGTFRPLPGSKPFSGEEGLRSEVGEVRVEVVVETWKLSEVLVALKEAHPYEEVAHSIWTLTNTSGHVGSGMVGELSAPMPEEAFLDQLKKNLGCGAVRHTDLLGKPILKVAVCGGAGSFLLPDAIRCGADVFVTSDFKYHEFFGAENRLVIADVGHYESEWQTTHLIVSRLNNKFTNFAVHLAEANPNPIHYR
ncbi:Nif3-like dinuclear metal center hexameric protein [bacterium]|nr:Nif3-like dinuclear metal center hexameric protein [bacterium]